METPKKEMLLTHVVKDFSSLSGGYRYGPDMLCANMKWRIGCRKTETQSIAIQLFCRRPRTDKVWSVATKFTIRLLSVNGKAWPAEGTYTYANNSDYSGYGLFFGLDTLLKDYVVDDTLIIEIKATIEAMTGVEQPEKKRSFEKSTEEPSDVILKVADQKFHLVYMEDALTDDNVKDVLQLVDMYIAKNVARLCEQFLMYESTLSMRTKLQIAGKFKFEKLKNHCIENVKTRADVRAAMPSDPSQSDASICHALLEKMVTM